MGSFWGALVIQHVNILLKYLPLEMLKVTWGRLSSIGKAILREGNKVRSRFCLGALLIILLAILVGCTTSTTNPGSGNNDTESSETPAEPLSDSEIKRMYSNPSDYIGSTVELVGVIFGGVDYDGAGIYFQMWADPENIDYNTVVAYFDPELTLEDGQYIRISGTVIDVFEGENMMGGQIVAPAIQADTLEVISYKDAVRPTVATATAINNTVEQYGYSVTVQSVELAEKETRVYITVTNNGSSEFSLYGFNMVLIQDGTQYEYTPNYMADYPELQSSIRTGITTEGVVVFPAIQQEPFQIIMEASTYDWNQPLQEYVFDFNIAE